MKVIDKKTNNRLESTNPVVIKSWTDNADRYTIVAVKTAEKASTESDESVEPKRRKE